jgi:hypothetical protein
VSVHCVLCALFAVYVLTQPSPTALLTVLLQRAHSERLSDNDDSESSESVRVLRQHW